MSITRTQVNDVAAVARLEIAWDAITRAIDYVPAAEQVVLRRVSRTLKKVADKLVKDLGVIEE